LKIHTPLDRVNMRRVIGIPYLSRRNRSLTDNLPSLENCVCNLKLAELSHLVKGNGTSAKTEHTSLESANNSTNG